MIVSVYAIFANDEEARRIGRLAVEEKLAACVNILGPCRSIYRWQGKVDSTGEVLMLIKTRADLVPEVETTIASLHSYQVPEVLVLPVFGGSHAYLAWLADSLR